MWPAAECAGSVIHTVWLSSGRHLLAISWTCDLATWAGLTLGDDINSGGEVTMATWRGHQWLIITCFHFTLRSNVKLPGNTQVVLLWRSGCLVRLQVLFWRETRWFPVLLSVTCRYSPLWIFSGARHKQTGMRLLLLGERTAESSGESYRETGPSGRQSDARSGRSPVVSPLSSYAVTGELMAERRHVETFGDVDKVTSHWRHM